MMPPARIGRLLVLLRVVSVLSSAAASVAGCLGGFVPVSADAAPLQQPADEYRQKLEEYLRAQQQFEVANEMYWRSVAEKRRARADKRRNNEVIGLDDYILPQPPVYSAPPKPIGPLGAQAEPQPPPPKKYIPVVADFLDSATQHFNFVPQRPGSELEFKRAYAAVAAAAGISKEQAVRIYGFEASGNGTYEVQAGLEYPGRPGAEAISTALGYNQLLATNTIELLAQKGDQFIALLAQKSRALSGDAKGAMERKISVLRSMVDFCRTVPDEWSEHDTLARTPQGLGVHALNLDVDVGPLLQTQQLLGSILYARANGYDQPLSAAELEMMNLTGDANGLDMITMSPEMRSRVPTANFFERRGYKRNPVAIRNSVVATLVAATDAIMDRETKLQGARDLAAVFPD
jgi:hypothetical protein